MCVHIAQLHMKAVAFTQTHEYMEGELAGGLMKGPIHFLCFTLRITLATPTHNISQRTTLLGSQTIHALFVTLKATTNALNEVRLHFPPT